MKKILEVSTLCLAFTCFASPAFSQPPVEDMHVHVHSAGLTKVTLLNNDTTGNNPFGDIVGNDVAALVNLDSTWENDVHPNFIIESVVASAETSFAVAGGDSYRVYAMTTSWDANSTIASIRSEFSNIATIAANDAVFWQNSSFLSSNQIGWNATGAVNFFAPNRGFLIRHKSPQDGPNNRIETLSFSIRGHIMGDANNDGEVNATDLNALALNWGQSGKTWAEGDFTGEGDVNATDLNWIALNWEL